MADNSYLMKGFKMQINNAIDLMIIASSGGVDEKTILYMKNLKAQIDNTINLIITSSKEEIKRLNIPQDQTESDSKQTIAKLEFSCDVMKKNIEELRAENNKLQEINKALEDIADERERVMLYLCRSFDGMINTFNRKEVKDELNQ